MADGIISFSGIANRICRFAAAEAEPATRVIKDRLEICSKVIL